MCDDGMRGLLEAQTPLHVCQEHGQGARCPCALSDAPSPLPVLQSWTTQLTCLAQAPQQRGRVRE